MCSHTMSLYFSFRAIRFLQMDRRSYPQTEKVLSSLKQLKAINHKPENSERAVFSIWNEERAGSLRSLCHHDINKNSFIE